MRIRWLAALGAVLGLATAATAQPAAPTVEVRVQSVNVLFDKAEYVALLGGKDDVVRTVKGFLKSLNVEGQGIEGIDPKRPFGAYATLSADPVNSPFTVLVPIADEDRFLAMLKERFDITPEKVDGGAFKITLPDGVKNPVIDALYIRFSDGYLHVARFAKDLDPKTLIAPKTFFAKDDGSVLSVLVRGDRIPDEVKTFVLGQMELGLAEERKKSENKNPAEKAGLEFGSDAVMSVAKSLLEDSKELAVRVFIDQKADELSAEVVLTPRTGTPMSKYVTSMAGKPSLPAGIVSAKDAIARVTVKYGLPPEMKERYGKLVDETITAALKDVDEGGREIAERVFKVLGPTIKSAEADLAAALYAPNAKGKHTFLAALAVKDGKEIEKLVKDFSQFAAGHADFTFDVETIGDFTLHKIELNDLPPESDKFFGTKILWVAISDKTIVASIEPDGTAIRDSLKAKAATVPVLSVDVSLAKLFPLVANKLQPDEVKAILKDTFGDAGPTGKDTVTVTITGGDQLTARAKVKGKGVKLFVSAFMLAGN